MKIRHWVVSLLLAVMVMSNAGSAQTFFVKKDTWVDTVLATRENIRTFKGEHEKEMRQSGLNGLTVAQWHVLQWRLPQEEWASAIETATALDTDISDNKIDLRKTYEHGDRSRWNRWRDFEDGQVDELPRHGLTYLCRKIRTRRAMRIPVYLGSSAGMKVWLNGTCVHTQHGQREFEPNQDVISLSLKKGDNWLVLKLSHAPQGPRRIYTSFIKKPGSYNLGKITEEAWRSLYAAYPIESDWMLQSAGKRDCSEWLVSDKITRRKLEAFVTGCRKRRHARLQPLRKRWKHILFTKHGDLGGSHYAYTEGQSDAQAERQFFPGSSLCVLDVEDSFGKVHTLTNDQHGTIRDPDVSYDGKHILFAWKKSDRKDDFHLYEMDVKTRKVNQITEGLGFADYEGVYLPDDTIIFNSTRCVQIVDCWWTEVSNIYTCDRSGRYLRRLGFDQVHSNYPQVLDDGRVIYTRWDYNDRGQIYPQPLFQMNYDGTGQTEYYGNNSWFPTTIMHARGIPGSRKLIAVLSGHHSRQQGKLALVDASKGRQEAEGIQLVAPVQETKAVKVDAYGQRGELFQYPYALSETNYLVAYRPDSSFRFGIYYMTAAGERELLAYDPKVSCNQPVPLAARRRPHLRPGMVDYRKDTGTYYLKDIYHGPGLKDVARGSIKKLRVVALEFRAAGVGSNGSGGPAGGALSSTPIAIGNGAWDVKKVLGETPVYEDGSACVVVPARTPVYFQAIDEDGHVAQTMRSWSTLMPGETFGCVGCHEHKNAAPPFNTKTRAMVNSPQELEPFYGPTRGFSYIKEVQPVLDAKCVSCHNGSHKKNIDLRGEAVVDASAKRKWSRSYLTLTQSPLQGNAMRGNSNGQYVKWISVQSVPTMLPAYYRGSATSPLITMLKKGHQKVKLTQAELDRLSCWIDLSVPYCGDYYEANTWNEAERKKYDHHRAKRQKMAEQEENNIKEYIAASQQVVKHE